MILPVYKDGPVAASEKLTQARLTDNTSVAHLKGLDWQIRCLQEVLLSSLAAPGKIA